MVGLNFEMLEVIMEGFGFFFFYFLFVFEGEGSVGDWA